MKRLFHITSLVCASLLFLIPSLAVAQELTIGNYSLVGRERVGRAEFNYTYHADVTNTGPAVRDVTANVTSDSEHTVVVDGKLTFGEVPAQNTVSSSDTFTIRQDRLFPFDPVALVWEVQATPVPPTTPESSKIEGNLIRNGAFELGDTGWARNQWTYSDDGKEGVGMRINPFSAPNNQGFIMQELHLPSELESGVFSFEYHIQAQPGLQPSLGGFGASLITWEGNILATLHTIDANSFPGFGWQSVRVVLNTEALSQLNTTHAASSRVFLLIALMGEYIDAVVDNVVFQVEGTMKLPNIPGVIAYIRDGKEIRRIRSNGSDDALIWRPSSTIGVSHDIFDVAWRPDSKALAFSSNHEYGYSRWSSDIYVMRPDGSELQRVTNPPALSKLPGDYPTGIVTGKVHNDTGRFISIIVYVQGATKPAQKSSGLLPPDGNSGDTLDFTIEVADLGPGVGQYVAVWEEGYPEAQMAVDVQAGKTVDAGIIDYTGLRNTYTVSQITWRGDGSQIGFVLSTILRRIKANATFTDMDEPLVDLNLFASSPAWFPQGDKILYVQGFSSEKDGIYLTDVGSANEGTRLVFPTQIASSAEEPVWLPDGSGFLYVQRQSKSGVSGADIFQYDMASGQAVPLTDFWNEQAAHPSPSPDGQYIVFERLPENSEHRDLWVMKRDDPTIMWILTNDGKSSNPDWSHAEP